MTSFKSEVDIEIETDDIRILESMGYKQDLKRGLGGLMNFAFGFTEVGVITCFSGAFTGGLSTGGPVVIFWSWVITFAFTMCVACSMAEICSAYPSAGSVYHWAGMIVPKEHKAVSSYIVGWMNFLGNAAGDASFAAVFASFLCSTIAINGGADMGTGAQVGISIAIMILWSLINFFDITKVGFINNIAAVIQFATIGFILIGLLSSATHSQFSTGKTVFTEFNNETGFTSKSYVCCIGLLTALFSFSGYEASAHMAEETKGSRTAAPKGIIYTCLSTGMVGMAYILALLFVTNNIDDVLNGRTDNAVINIFFSVGGQNYGSLLAWLIVINCFFGGLSSVTVTGRITYAFARDGGFPMSDYWAHINEKTQSPIRAIVLVLIFDALLLLLPLVSTVAFNSILSICTIGFQTSYATPIFLKLLYAWDNFPQTEMNFGTGAAGRFKSNVCGIISCLWLYGTSCILFFPTAYPIVYTGPDGNMNWAIVVVGGFAVLALFYWFIYARYNFRGPNKKEDDLVFEKLTNDVGESNRQDEVMPATATAC